MTEAKLFGAQALRFPDLTLPTAERRNGSARMLPIRRGARGHMQAHRIRHPTASDRVLATPHPGRVSGGTRSCRRQWPGRVRDLRGRAAIDNQIYTRPQNASASSQSPLNRPLDRSRGRGRVRGSARQAFFVGVYGFVGCAAASSIQPALTRALMIMAPHCSRDSPNPASTPAWVVDFSPMGSTQP